LEGFGKKKERSLFMGRGGVKSLLRATPGKLQDNLAYESVFVTTGEDGGDKGP